jgi:hypothetical protein
MKTIQDIFRVHAPMYLEKFGDKIPSQHKKVIQAILKCKTHGCGAIVYSCKNCKTTHSVPLGCGNRHCPGCQHSKTSEWLERQTLKQLPGSHFMVTFTVPKELRDFIRSNQKLGYTELFSASSKALKKLAADSKFSGGAISGFMGVLHTWGRQLPYHPHMHYLVPGGTLSKDKTTWLPTGNKFYLPVHALSKIFRGKMKDAFRTAGVLDQIPREVWNQPWIVNCKPVGDGEFTLKYLAPYVFRVAISNSRILKIENDKVHISYKKSGSKRLRTLVLSPLEFMRRFLQHVLPSGFMKIRYFGFMSPNFSLSLEKIRELIQTSGACTAKEIQKIATVLLTSISPVCPDCGGALSLLDIVFPERNSPSG